MNSMVLNPDNHIHGNPTRKCLNCGCERFKRDGKGLSLYCEDCDEKYYE